MIITWQAIYSNAGTKGVRMVEDGPGAEGREEWGRRGANGEAAWARTRNSPGWRGSTWTTGRNGTRKPPPAWAITGSTRACPIRRRGPWRTKGARLTAGPRG